MKENKTVKDLLAIFIFYSQKLFKESIVLMSACRLQPKERACTAQKFLKHTENFLTNLR